MVHPVDGKPQVEAGASRKSGRGAVADLNRGTGVIQEMAKRLPGSPGVYRMVDGRGDVLYVGKARNLKKRVVQYTQIARLSNRLRRMVAETRSMEVTTTR
ncbi:MAG: GIY-YIG nuclease family protein, partial [Alphaproteobacteria bacterium]|nr:GIY-YIG nuclease family protein [Alphaproteobacteria bacterium]